MQIAVGFLGSHGAAARMLGGDWLDGSISRLTAGACLGCTGRCGSSRRARALPKNQPRLQYGRSSNKFIDTFGTAAKWEAALRRARWPTGSLCFEPGGHEHSSLCAAGRRDRQWTDLPGSVDGALRDTLSCVQAGTDPMAPGAALPGHAEQRHLGVAYATAWRVEHKRLEAGVQRASACLRRGVVVADDAVLGGVRGGTPGRGCENTAPFAAAVGSTRKSTRQRVRLDAIRGLNRYLAEPRYRVNRRLDLAPLGGWLVHACARTPPSPERRLRLALVSGVAEASSESPGWTARAYASQSARRIRYV